MQNCRKQKFSYYTNHHALFEDQMSYKKKEKITK